MAYEYAEVHVYDVAGTTMRGALPVEGLQWSDEVGGGGSVSFTAYLAQPQLQTDPHLLDDCVVKIAVPLVAGATPTEVAAYAVRNVERVLVDARPAVRVSSAGTLLGVWGTDAVVRPEYAASAASMPALAGTERALSWVASEYDPADDPTLWQTPITFSRTDPTGWPTGTGAAWIRPNVLPTAAERMLFRAWITIATLGVYRFHVSADESTTLWVAGEVLLRTDDQEYGRRRVYVAERVMYPGTYAVAVDSLLVDSGSAGDGQDGLKLAACSLDNDGEPATWLLVTNTSAWVTTGAADDTVMPGPTNGAVLLALSAEADARGVTTWGVLTVDFDADDDSNGDPWPASVERVYRYGHDDYSRVIATLADDQCDCRITPGLVLQARQFEGSDVSAAVLLRPSREIAAWSERRTPPLGSVADVETSVGWVTVTSPAAVAAYGRREFAMPLATVASLKQARRVATQALTEHGQPRWDGTVEFIAMPGTVPYVDFRPGDTVRLLYPDGTQGARRVLSVSADASEGPVRLQAELGEPNL
jgi:hypothetical protein